MCTYAEREGGDGPDGTLRGEGGGGGGEGGGGERSLSIFNGSVGTGSSRFFLLPPENVKRMDEGVVTLEFSSWGEGKREKDGRNREGEIRELYVSANFPLLLLLVRNSGSALLDDGILLGFNDSEKLGAESQCIPIQKGKNRTKIRRWKRRT